MQYQIMHKGKVIVWKNKIVSLEHAQQIKAAIDNQEWDIEVQVVEVLEPVVPRALPKVGYCLYWEDGKDILKLQVSESAYGGWSFEEEGFDRDCRLYERSDGHPHTVLVYATSSTEAVEMAHRIRTIFDEQAPQREEMRRKAEELAAQRREEALARAGLDEDDEDDDWQFNDHWSE